MTHTHLLGDGTSMSEPIRALARTRAPLRKPSKLQVIHSDVPLSCIDEVAVVPSPPGANSAPFLSCKDKVSGDGMFMFLTIDGDQ